MKTLESGKNGETAAENYLLKNGYTILEKNYHSRYGEIDIIAKKDGCTVFVEVKARKRNDYGMPSEFVTKKKQDKIRKTAFKYLDDTECDMRFDVAEIFYEEVYGDFMVKKINYIENAF